MLLLPRLMWLSSWKVPMSLSRFPTAAISVGVADVISILAAFARGAGRNERLVVWVAAFAYDPRG